MVNWGHSQCPRTFREHLCATAAFPYTMRCTSHAPRQPRSNPSSQICWSQSWGRWGKVVALCCPSMSRPLPLHSGAHTVPANNQSPAREHECIWLAVLGSAHREHRFLRHNNGQGKFFVQLEDTRVWTNALRPTNLYSSNTCLKVDITPYHQPTLAHHLWSAKSKKGGKSSAFTASSMTTGWLRTTFHPRTRAAKRVSKLYAWTAAMRQIPRPGNAEVYVSRPTLKATHAKNRKVQTTHTMAWAGVGRFKRATGKGSVDTICCGARPSLNTDLSNPRDEWRPRIAVSIKKWVIHWLST